MTSLLQAAKQTLEALENPRTNWLVVQRQIEKTLRQAIAQAEQQEPMYFGLTHDHTWLSISEKQYNKLGEAGRMKVYTAPPRSHEVTSDLQREWVEPSDERAFELAKSSEGKSRHWLVWETLKLAKELNT